MELVEPTTGRAQPMTLFELIFVVFLLSLGAVAGVYGFASGGIWIGITYALLAVACSFATIQAASKVSGRFHKSRMKCPCSLCKDDDYVWVGNDERSNPIAKYRCGRFVVLKGNKCEEVQRK